jgi:hypothetical protein
MRDERSRDASLPGVSVKGLPGSEFPHNLPRSPHVLDPTFGCPDLTTFCSLDGWVWR